MKHRLLFYSHDSYGLGHFQRSLTIASFLTRHIDGLSALMLTGVDAPASFEKPRGLDFIKLPSIWKAGAESYATRHLKVSFARVRRIREDLIRTVARDYEPAMVIVDNVPTGVDGELLPTLRYLRRRRPRTKIVVTLRDVLDEPERIIAEWRRQGTYEALERFYDEIWVAGDRAIFDPVAMYEFPDAITARVKFCGYVVRSLPASDEPALRRELRLGGRPIVVVSCGGGGDGYPLIEAYVQALERSPLAAVESLVFLGPDMSPAERRDVKRRLASRSDDVIVFDYRPDLVAFLRVAALSFSMGGYNTMCEVVSLGTPAVIVPRTTPRVEQLLRAESFARRGLVRILMPEKLSAESILAELATVSMQPVAAAHRAAEEVDFAGPTRIARRVRKHLGLADGPGS